MASLDSLSESSVDKQPVLDPRPLMSRYYDLAESRLGYKLLLGDARHFAYYESERDWPFPVGDGLRRMERKIYDELNLPKGGKVLDCGCGYGLVARFMAQHGLRVEAIDFVPRHVDRATRLMARSGLDRAVKVRRADYHNLDFFPDDSFDGVYTSETFVHATDPLRALRGWLRILKPGARLVLSEYAWKDWRDPKYPHRRRLKERLDIINKWSDMPSFGTVGEMPGWVEQAGFEDVQVVDITRNVVPMMWLFWALAFIPYLFVQMLRLEPHFPNVVAGVEMYRGLGDWEFFHIVAKKPLGSSKGRGRNT